MAWVITSAAVAVAARVPSYAWRRDHLERLRSKARVSALAAAIEGTSAAPAAPSAMFARDPESAVHGRPLLTLAIGFGMAVLILVLIAMSGGRHDAPAPAAAAADASR